MDILSLFVAVPVLTIIALVFTKGLKQARLVSMVGSIIQLGMAINLVFAYFKERAINKEIMVFTKDYVGLNNSIYIMLLVLTEFQLPFYY